MDSENAKKPPSDLQSEETPQKDTIHLGHSAPGRPEHSANEAPSARPPTRSRPSTQPRRPDASAPTTPSKTPATPAEHQRPTEHQGPPEHQRPTEHQVHLSKSKTEAIQKRAKGRARVPPQFRDSFKRFFFSPTGALKVARLGLLIGAFVCFIISEAHESYITITVVEASIVLCFILVYMLTLHRLMTYLHWPLLDLINTFITAVFLLIVAILTIQEKDRRHLFYVGGTLCLTAAILCLVDATLVTKTMRNNIKRALGMKKEPDHSLAQAEPPNPPSKNL
uniref:CKLF like MARVEL transmembrane domain containing 1 n=1 Tax=Rousettus aegyptiacus TaxID=9407 RepID=A0A7J8CF22_ROUAE|nr:CKLF like MARVEL transmembrane domain containing 1 [Rousettus aegyptiacus]